MERYVSIYYLAKETKGYSEANEVYDCTSGQFGIFYLHQILDFSDRFSHFHHSSSLQGACYYFNGNSLEEWIGKLSIIDVKFNDLATQDFAGVIAL